MHDFSPFGEDSDLPGDPDAVANLAARYGDTANEIIDAAAKLDQITARGSEAYKGKGGDALISKTGDLASRVLKAKDRYAVTAKALADFAGVMEDTQYAAAQAASAGRDAAAEVTRTAAIPVDSTLTGDAKSTAADTANRLSAQHTAALTDLATYKSRWATQKGLYDDAATAAKNAIHDVSNDDGLKDSWFYKHFTAIVTALLIIAIIIVVIAVVCLAPELLIAGLGLIGVETTAATIATVASVAELAGAGFAVLTLAVDLKGLQDGLATKGQVEMDLLAVATVGLSRFVIAPRLASLAEKTTDAVALAKAGETTSQLMKGFQLATELAPDAETAAALAKIAPAFADKAAEAGVEAMNAVIEGAEGAEKAKLADVALQVLIRSDGENAAALAKLAYLTGESEEALEPAIKAYKLAVTGGLLTSVTDYNVTKYTTTHTIHDIQEEHEQHASAQEHIAAVEKQLSGSR